MNLKNVLEMMQEESQLEKYDEHLKYINYQLADDLSYSLFTAVDCNAKKMEIMYKLYILGVLDNDKKMRIKCLKHLKEMFPDLIDSLKEFKDKYKNSKERK